MSDGVYSEGRGPPNQNAVLPSLLDPSTVHKSRLTCLKHHNVQKEEGCVQSACFNTAICSYGGNMQRLSTFRARPGFKGLGGLRQLELHKWGFGMTRQRSLVSTAPTCVSTLCSSIFVSMRYALSRALPERSPERGLRRIPKQPGSAALRQASEPASQLACRLPGLACRLPGPAAGHAFGRAGPASEPDGEAGGQVESLRIARSRKKC